MPISRLIIDSLININLILCMGLALWFVARGALALFGLKQAHGLQLRLLNAVFVAALATPGVTWLVAHLRQEGVIAPTAQLSLSDFALAQYLHGGFNLRPTEFVQLMSLRETATAALVNGTSPVALVVIALFLAGAGIVALRLVRQGLLVRRAVLRSYHWRRFGRVALRVSDTSPIPFSTRGWRGHFIVIPAGMLANRADLNIALAHEFQHLRQGDTTWEILFEILRAVFFWNPAFMLLKRQVERLRELACDQLVLARGRTAPSAYADCLLRVCAASLERGHHGRPATATVPLVLAFGPGDRRRAAALQARVMAILTAEAPRGSRLAGHLALLALVVGLAGAAVAVQRQGGWSHDRLMLATIVNLERLDQRPGFGMRGY